MVGATIVRADRTIILSNGPPPRVLGDEGSNGLGDVYSEVPLLLQHGVDGPREEPINPFPARWAQVPREVQHEVAIPTSRESTIADQLIPLHVGQSRTCDS